MQLINPTNEQLDEAFALRVSYWHPGVNELEAMETWCKAGGEKYTPFSLGQKAAAFFRPRYSTKTDEVLPWLVHHTKKTNELRHGEGDTWRIYAPAEETDVWTVNVVWMHHDGWIEETASGGQATTLARAATIALLRQNGVEIIERKEDAKEKTDLIH